MAWILIQVTDIEWIQDDSGYYTLINWIDVNNVRLDIMRTDDTPVISFQGKAENVRKRIMRFALGISTEHAAYIGAELARAELLKVDYVQD